MTDPSSLLDTALHAAQLKRMPRTGWLQRGVTMPENVAAHSYGVVFLTMLLLEADERALDKELALRMAIVHDLAESLVTDLPTSASKLLSKSVKHEAERTALAHILGGEFSVVSSAWQEYAAGESPEAQVVKDADTLDMMIQAYNYEQAGQRNLGEFWANRTAASFYTAAAQAIYSDLVARRTALWQGQAEP